MLTTIFRKVICAVFAILLLQSCERDMEKYPHNDETSLAKNWYDVNGKPFPLDWSKLEIINENNGNTSIVVSLENGLNLGADNSMQEYLIFTVRENKVLKANKVDLFSDTRTVAEYAKEAISNFVKNQGYRSKDLGKVYFMVYDLQKKLLYSQLLDSAGVKNVNLQLKVQDNDTKLKAGNKSSSEGKNISVVCIDWFLVQDNNDGSEHWLYLYTTCSSSSSGNGGGAGGGGSATSYLYEAPTDQIVLQDVLNCFNTIPSNTQTTYKITIHSHLANPNAPNQVYNFSSNDPGHAYITMEKSNGSTSRSLTFGFYPSQDTWITGTKNAVTSSIGQEDPNLRNSDARYTITVNESTFNHARNMALTKSTKPYDLNDYNCTDYAIDVFDAALGGSGLAVPNSPIGFTTPAGLYGRLNELKTAGISGISLTQSSAPSSTAACN